MKKGILSILVPGMVAGAMALGFDLTPSPAAAMVIVPITSLLALGFGKLVTLPPVVKPIMAGLVGVGWNAATQLQADLPMAMPMMLLQGVTDGFFAMGLWSGAKAAAETVVKTPAPPNPA